jgi:hypothetical protein
MARKEPPVVRRLTLAAFVALSAVLLAAPIAFAQTAENGQTGMGSGQEYGQDAGAKQEMNAKEAGKEEYNKKEEGKEEYEEYYLSAMLSGKNEVPGPGSGEASGTAAVEIKGDMICVKLSWKGLDADDPATAAHIHKGKAGVAGGVVVPFFQGMAMKSPFNKCIEADKALAEDIAHEPDEYYVNVHNKEYPNGAIRGQLAKADKQAVAGLPFTGNSSSRLLLIGSVITALGMVLLFAGRRYGIVGGRHLASAVAGRHEAWRGAADHRAGRRSRTL